ncbi:hypothetical protein RYX36_034966 [Vicia faba]
MVEKGPWSCKPEDLFSPCNCDSGKEQKRPALPSMSERCFKSSNIDSSSDNFEDVDRMMLNYDSTFGMGSLNNEDEFCWLSSSHGTEGPVGDALKCEFKFSPADASPLKSISESDYNMDLKDNIKGLPILDCDKKTSPFDIKLRCEMEVDLDAVPTSLSTFGESDMTSGITDDLMPEQKIQGQLLKQPVQPCIERLKSKNQ